MRGVGLILTEATAVAPEGRITARCLGLWNDEQEQALTKVIREVRAMAPGVVMGIQLAHAGRKGSLWPPWMGRGHGGTLAIGEEDSEGSGCRGFQTIAPSAAPYGALGVPMEMSLDDIRRTVQQFKEATLRAHRCGFDVVEIHAAHGYLLHQFLSPVSNQRSDEYGGQTFASRVRFVVEVCEAVRDAWPKEKPVFIRFSCTDWLDGDGGTDVFNVVDNDTGDNACAETLFDACTSWTLAQTQHLSALLHRRGLVDLVDCSSGGLSPNQRLPSPIVSGYQDHLSAAVRRACPALLTGAVGMIRDPLHAEQLLRDSRADLVFIARELLRDACWVQRAAAVLGVQSEVEWLAHYERGRVEGAYIGSTTG